MRPERARRASGRTPGRRARPRATGCWPCGIQAYSPFSTRGKCSKVFRPFAESRGRRGGGRNRAAEDEMGSATKIDAMLALRSEGRFLVGRDRIAILEAGGAARQHHRGREGAGLQLQDRMGRRGRHQQPHAAAGADRQGRRQARRRRHLDRGRPPPHRRLPPSGGEAGAHLHPHRRGRSGRPHRPAVLERGHEDQRPQCVPLHRHRRAPRAGECGGGAEGVGRPFHRRGDHQRQRRRSWHRGRAGGDGPGEGRPSSC